MWKCPICSNDEKSEYICQTCGYDVRKDFIRWKTVQQVPAQDAQGYVRMISDQDEKKKEKEDEAVKKLMEIIKMEQEKKAEAERKQREAEEALKVEQKRRQEMEEAEKRRREAEQAERRRRQVEEAARLRQTSQRPEAWCTAAEQEQKKKKFPTRIMAICILLLIVAVVMIMVISSFGENGGGISGGSADASVQYQDQVDSLLKSIIEDSIDELHNGAINYEAESQSAICEILSSYGYEISWPEMRNSTEDTETLFEDARGMLQDDNSSVSIYCTDAFISGESEREYRSLSFFAYYDDLAEDSLIEVHQSITPLPYGIEYGDTFETVCDKLGLNEEMINYAVDDSNPLSVYVSVDYPGIFGTQSGFIYMSRGGYYFSYSFSEGSNELTGYIVSIDN